MTLPSPLADHGSTFIPVPARRRPDVPRRNALSDLIHSRRIELGLTWEEAAKRGGFSSHTILYSLATKPEHKQVPRPVTLERVAKALELPLDIVKSAAAEAAGYTQQEVKVTLRNAAKVRALVATCEELPDEDVERLAAIAEAFIEQRRAASRAKK